MSLKTPCITVGSGLGNRFFLPHSSIPVLMAERPRESIPTACLPCVRTSSRPGSKIGSEQLSRSYHKADFPKANVFFPPPSVQNISSVMARIRANAAATRARPAPMCGLDEDTEGLVERAPGSLPSFQP